MYGTGPITNKNPDSRQWLQFTSHSQGAMWPEGQLLHRDPPVGLTELLSACFQIFIFLHLC